MSEDESSKSKAPKLQPETDRGGSGRPPRKTAIGYFAEGEDDDSHRKQPNLRFGQKMIVRVMAEVIGGYRVQIRDTSVEAFLKTDKSFGINILLAVIFKEFNKTGMPIFVLTNKEQENFVDGAPLLRRFQSERVDSSQFKYKRRCDTLPLSFGTNFERIDFEETNLRKFVTSLSEPNFNGCVKFSSQQLLARGFLIIFGGRCVRSEYSCASEHFERSTEESMLAILDNFTVEDAVVQKFNLARELVLTLSTPFLGSFDSWHLKHDTEDFVQTILDWFQFGSSKSGMISLHSENGTAWAAFFQGRFIGFFNVESQTFRNKIESLNQYVESSKEIDMQTYVLPDTNQGSTYNLGFDLRNALG